MFVAHSSELPWDVESTGTEYKLLNDPEDGARDEFVMTLRRYGEASDSLSYRAHRHKIEQIRYVLRGDAGPTNGISSPTGSLVYVGASTFYGPLDRTVETEYLSVKFGGTEDTSRPFPKARHLTPIVLSPSGFEWKTEGPGVASKLLGQFTERGTQLSMVALEPKTVWIRRIPQSTVMFILEGRGQLNGGHRLAPQDGVTVSSHERFCVSAEDHLELLVLNLPPANHG